MSIYGLKFRFALYADWESRVTSAPLDQEILHVFPGAVIERVTRHDLLKTSLYKDLTAFILPGIIGEDSLYPHHIGPANHLIRDYVAGGGIFKGQCAGAYATGTGSRYVRGWGPHKSEDENHLALFSGYISGPPEGLHVRDEDTHFEGLRMTTLLADVLGTTYEVPVAYSSGPAFTLSPKQQFRIHARYAEAVGQPPAIISYHYGRGLVMLSGPMLQYSGRPHSWLPEHKKLAPILDRLTAHETGRKRLFRSLMAHIAAHARQIGPIAVLA